MVYSYHVRLHRFMRLQMLNLPEGGQHCDRLINRNIGVPRAGRIEKV